MRISRTLGAALAAAALGWAVLAGAPAPASEHWDADWDEETRLQGTLSGKQYAAGGRVSVDAQVDGDLFLAGGEVIGRDAAAHDVYAVGGWVELRGLSARDAVVAAGTLDLSGALDGDLIAAGGNVALARDSRVAGDALVAGWRVALAGTVAGELRAAAQTLRLDGTIEGPVRAAARHITVGPDAVIAGDLRYSAEGEIEIAEGAQVQGQVIRTGELDEMPGPFAFVLFGVLAWLGALVGAVLLAAALLAGLPQLLAGGRTALYLHPVPSLALGLAVAVTVPIVAALLMPTVIGAPVALVALALLVPLLACGLVVAAQALGGRLPWISPRFGPGTGYGTRLAQAAAGLLALALIALVPVLGALVVAVAVAFGTGAVAREAWRRLGAAEA